MGCVTPARQLRTILEKSILDITSSSSAAIEIVSELNRAGALSVMIPTFGFELEGANKISPAEGEVVVVVDVDVVENKNLRGRTPAKEGVGKRIPAPSDITRIEDRAYTRKIAWCMVICLL